MDEGTSKSPAKVVFYDKRVLLGFERTPKGQDEISTYDNIIEIVNG